MLDATNIFTAAPETAGTKTVYVKVACGATAADGSYAQQECIFTQLGVYADGTKGVIWPNDDEFDYNDPADYDKHPGLPSLPETPATENGTETFEVPGSSGCGAGASGGLAALLALAAVSLFGIFKR